MNRAAWAQPVDPMTAARRAGGRRRINEQRRAERASRQWQAVELWKAGRSSKEIAAEVGVVVRVVNRYLRGVRTLASQRELARLNSELFRIVQNGLQDR